MFNKNYGSDFKKGDIITYCNEEFIVLENYGNHGKVQEYPDGDIINNFKWEVYGEKCIKKMKD